MKAQELTIKQIAKLYNCSVTTANGLVGRPEINRYCLGGLSPRIYKIDDESIKSFDRAFGFRGFRRKCTD